MEEEQDLEVDSPHFELFNVQPMGLKACGTATLTLSFLICYNGVDANG